MKTTRVLATVGLFVSYLLFGPALASANTMFNVAGNSDGVEHLPGDFTGTLTVNTDTGNITGVNIKFPTLSAFVQVLRDGPQSGGNWEFLAVNPPDMDSLDLTFSTSPTAGSLIGFTGGSLVFGLVQQNPPGGVLIFTNFRGSITPALSTPAPAPEPSSQALLALGLLAWPLFALLRRKNADGGSKLLSRPSTLSDSTAFVRITPSAQIRRGRTFRYRLHRSRRRLW